MAYAAARKFMVDGQLRPNKVTDVQVLAAMARLPREIFTPDEARPRAYADDAVPLAPGRGMMAPMVLARLLQAALPRLGEQALVVGAATGYAAAVLADIGLVVTALEENAALLASAHAAWAQALPGAQPVAVRGPLAEGHDAGAPYHLILVDGSIQKVPDALIAQLAEGGRMVFIHSSPGGLPVAMLGRKLGGAFITTPIMDAAAPTLPGFAPAPSFVF